MHNHSHNSKDHISLDLSDLIISERVEYVNNFILGKGEEKKTRQKGEKRNKSFAIQRQIESRII